MTLVDRPATVLGEKSRPSMTPDSLDGDLVDPSYLQSALVGVQGERNVDQVPECGFVPENGKWGA